MEFQILSGAGATVLLLGRKLWHDVCCICLRNISKNSNCGSLCSQVWSVLDWFSRKTTVTRDLLVLVGTFCGGLILGLPDLAY